MTKKFFSLTNSSRRQQPSERVDGAQIPAEPGAELLGLYRPALLKFFRRRTGNAADAEDLTQEVLLRALVHTRWESSERAKNHIFRIAINCWRDRLRRLRAHGTEIDWDHDPDRKWEELGAQISPERVLAVQEQLDQIAAALDEMPIRTRTVLLLIRVEKMRIANVAQMLGMSVSAVNKHLARGLAVLARLRKRQEGFDD